MTKLSDRFRRELLDQHGSGSTEPADEDWDLRGCEHVVAMNTLHDRFARVSVHLLGIE